MGILTACACHLILQMGTSQDQAEVFLVYYMYITSVLNLYHL